MGRRKRDKVEGSDVKRKEAMGWLGSARDEGWGRWGGVDGVGASGGVGAAQFCLSEEDLELLLVDTFFARDARAREHRHELLHGELAASVLVDDAEHLLELGALLGAQHVLNLLFGLLGIAPTLEGGEVLLVGQWVEQRQQLEKGDRA